MRSVAAEINLSLLVSELAFVGEMYAVRLSVLDMGWGATWDRSSCAKWISTGSRGDGRQELHSRCSTPDTFSAPSPRLRLFQARDVYACRQPEPPPLSSESPSSFPRCISTMA